MSSTLTGDVPEAPVATLPSCTPPAGRRASGWYWAGRAGGSPPATCHTQNINTQRHTRAKRNITHTTLSGIRAQGTSTDDYKFCKAVMLMNTIAINSWLSSLVVLTDGWLGWRWLGWWRWWRRWWRWRRRGWCGHLAEFPPWRGLAQGYGMSSLHLLRGVLGQVFHNWKKEMCQWFDWVWIIKHDEISVLDTRCAAKD